MTISHDVTHTSERGSRNPRGPRPGALRSGAFGLFGLFGPFVLAVALLFAAATAARAEQVIEPPASFLAAAFDGAPPRPSVLWLTPDIQQQVEKVAGHPLPGLRLRYWRKGTRSAWILDEIGKEEPITAGFVVENGRIVRASVLVYRETRGYEIRYPQFRDQFRNATLNDKGELDRRIDGIAGATLSVNAMIRMARTALLLDRITGAKGK